MFFESLTSTLKSDDLLESMKLDAAEESDIEDEHASVKKPLLSVTTTESKDLKLNSFLLNEKQYIDQEIKLFGLFVISFDTKLGNTVEWHAIVGDLSISRIEFKAMPSGIHLMQNDFIYFREGKLYGLAVFQCLKLNNEQERNHRMKSIAILSNSFKYLHKFIDFLLVQVKSQLENPGQYEALIEFWNSYSNPLESQIMILDPNPEILENYHNSIKNSFSNFLNYFGANVFLIWKYALLNKRILFYNIPPISLNCLHIYCCFILKNSTFKKIIDKQFLKAFFYINLHDIDLIVNESFYVAYTSEKIFETKTYLYDLYINQKEFMYPNQFDTKNAACVTNNKIIRLTRVDEKRFKFLRTFKSLFASPAFTGIDSLFGSEEQFFINFFTELNDRLFGTLLEIENFNQQVTPEHMKLMNLDPNEDRDFLLQIIRFYDINVRLVPKESFCSRKS